MGKNHGWVSRGFFIKFEEWDSQSELVESHLDIWEYSQLEIVWADWDNWPVDIFKWAPSTRLLVAFIVYLYPRKKLRQNIKWFKQNETGNETLKVEAKNIKQKAKNKVLN